MPNIPNIPSSMKGGLLTPPIIQIRAFSAVRSIVVSHECRFGGNSLSKLFETSVASRKIYGWFSRRFSVKKSRILRRRITTYDDDSQQMPRIWCLNNCCSRRGLLYSLEEGWCQIRPPHRGCLWRERELIDTSVPERRFAGRCALRRAQLPAVLSCMQRSVSSLVFHLRLSSIFKMENSC